MHFPQTSGDRPIRDSAYWTDVTLAGVGMVCIVAGIGHFLDWFTERKPVDAKVGLAFLVGYGVLLLISPRRFNLVIYSLVAIVACGLFNAIVMRTLWGLPIILPAALVAYLLLKRKGHLLK